MRRLRSEIGLVFSRMAFALARFGAWVAGVHIDPPSSETLRRFEAWDRVHRGDEE